MIKIGTKSIFWNWPSWYFGLEREWSELIYPGETMIQNSQLIEYYLQNAVRDATTSNYYWFNILWNFYIFVNIALKRRIFFGFAFFTEWVISVVGGFGNSTMADMIISGFFYKRNIKIGERYSFKIKSSKITRSWMTISTVYITIMLYFSSHLKN